MSGPDEDRPANLPAPYRVGYRRPPAEHQFQKGASGNPKGRPRGARNKTKVQTGIGMRGAETYLRMEAYRPVTLREGDKVIELPAIQAVFRAMGVSALKGNRFAQRTLSEMVTRLEEEDARSRLELFGSSVEYKRNWTEAIERANKAGVEPPRPIPHPDDIILNPSDGSVRFDGPMTKEERDRLDKALERRAEAQENVDFFAEKYSRARSEASKAMYLDEWHWEQRMFDIVNDIVPPRYKVKLDNRSFQEGASREGKALEELQANRELRQQYVG